MIEFLEGNTTLNGLYIETDNKLIKVEKEYFPTIEGFELAMKKSSKMNCNNKVVFHGYIQDGDIPKDFKITSTFRPFKSDFIFRLTTMYILYYVWAVI